MESPCEQFTIAFSDISKALRFIEAIHGAANFEVSHMSLSKDTETGADLTHVNIRRRTFERRSLSAMLAQISPEEHAQASAPRCLHGLLFSDDCPDCLRPGQSDNGL